MPAISSIELRRITIAPFADKLLEPNANVVVVTISIASGMDATRTTTAKLSDALTISASGFWCVTG